MIYSRRAIQRRLNELRPTIGDAAVQGLATRLNRPGSDCMAAMWETVVIHGLSKSGTLEYEVPLTSGREPDLRLVNDEIQITADVTCVTDNALDEANPYHELSEAVEAAKRKLGLPPGGLDLRVSAKQEETSRGSRTVLKLPPRGQLRAFVKGEIIPRLREQMRAGEKVLRISFDDDDVGLDITYDPARTPYNSGSYAAYNVPRTKDRNSLYGALKRKARQLQAVDGLTGIIVGDGDCGAMHVPKFSQDGFSSDEIIQEFFRQFSSVDFVWLLTVEEKRLPMGPGTTVRQNHVTFRVRDGCAHAGELKALCRAMMGRLPMPAMMPVNGALRARERDYNIGHHGGFRMTGSMIKISLREMTEVLAGIRTFADGGAKNVDAARKLARDREERTVELLIRRKLIEGRLPKSMKIVPGGEDDSDGWVEIVFGDPDPAISRPC